MRTTYTLTTLLLTCLLLLTGCYKGDIDDLRNEQAKQAERIAALETWQQTVNTNINALQGLVTALEAKDFVTSVLPKLEGGVEVGYTITFTKSSPVVIYHGTKGANGITPVMGVAKDTDDLYYWTVQLGTAPAEWLLDKEGNQVAAAGVNGHDAVSPQIRINATTNEWEVSTDGGTSWQPTGVKATGSSGAAGEAGANATPIFSAVDNDDDDYVVFTLTAGSTEIKLPKYKGISLTFAGVTDGVYQFSDYTGTLSFTSTGTPTSISIVSALPAGWRATVNKSEGKIDVFAAWTSSAKVLVVATDGSGASASYWITLKAEIPSSISVAYIYKGTFQMGSPDGEGGNNEKPQHWVKLTQDFYMSKYEITNAQYAAFLNAKGIGSDSDGKGKGADGEDFIIDSSVVPDEYYNWGLNWNGTKWGPAPGYANHPVIYVSWYGAKAYADWIGGSLPTEAQWEYACRAGTTTPHSFGSAAPGGYMWYIANAGMDVGLSHPDYGTHAVGTKIPNPWGLYDMHGNVSEWCLDQWDGSKNYPTANTKDDAIVDPCVTTGDYQIHRGGFYDNGENACRSATRFGLSPSMTRFGFGFRVLFKAP